MATLEKEAEDARLADEAAQAEAAAALRQQTLAEARSAVLSILIRPDGTQLTLADVGLSLRHDDLPAGLVVYSDGKVHLAASRRDEVWLPFLASLVDSGWTHVGERLTSLADLGRRLAAA